MNMHLDQPVVITLLLLFVSIVVVFLTLFVKSYKKPKSEKTVCKVDPFTYYLYTTKSDEVAEIEGLVAEGRSHGEAIDEMVRRHPLIDERRRHAS